MSSKQPHTCCSRGKRVHVVLKDGTEFVDKFRERRNHWVFFFARGKVRRGDISIFTIVRGGA